MSTGMSPTDVEPIKVSWSMLRAHEECKQKSALIRQHKRSPGGNLRGYYHGMVVDSAMRGYLADPDRRHGDMATRIDHLIDEGIEEARQTGDGVVRWKSATDRAELHAFCVELVTRLEPLLDRLVLPYDYVCGKRFKATLVADDTLILLTGEMDLFVQTPAGYQVWDLKGTRDDDYWRKVIGQLIFYDIATWCETRQYTTLTGLIQPMCTQPVIEHQVNDDDRRAMLARILRYVADVKAGRQDCKASTSGCGFCEVNHACARFRPTLSPAGNTMSLAAGLRDAARNATPDATPDAIRYALRDLEPSREPPQR